MFGISSSFTETSRHAKTTAPFKYKTIFARVIFNFWNFHLSISLIKFCITRHSAIVLSHKKDDEYPNYDFFSMSLKSLCETIVYAK